MLHYRLTYKSNLSIVLIPQLVSVAATRRFDVPEWTEARVTTLHLETAEVFVFSHCQHQKPTDDYGIYDSKKRCTEPVYASLGAPQPF